MLKILLIGLAGAAGTLGRYWVSVAVAGRYGPQRFPLDTVAVNVVGCFLIGLLFYAMRERFAAGEAASAVVIVGLLGGFTTFSSYGLQTFALLRAGEVGYAAANVAASNLLGVLMVWAGYALAKLLF